MSEIIINIKEANKAKKYADTGLFQREAFERVKNILDNHSYDKERSDDIVDCRFHDTVFIDGGRGEGKTAFMLNIKNYYENIVKSTKPKYLFLDPVDPTLLEHTEKFLSVILARIVEKVNFSSDHNEVELSNKYFESLEELSKSLSAIKTLPEDLGIEEIASNKSSLRLEQHSHTFFKEVCSLFGADAIIMLIDDIDMAFDKGFDVLEVVRKYLASPFLIPIVAGDMKLYREIVETHFMEKIKFSDDIKHLKAIYTEDKIKNSPEYIDKKKLLNDLIEQYLHKIFPNEYHIQLKDIFTILKENKVNIKFENDLEVPYKDLKDLEIRLINWGINQKEFTHQIFTNNTRDFVQYIYNKREIFNEVFNGFNSENYLEKEDKKTFIISNRLDSLIKEKIIRNPDIHKKSLTLTADFYRYSNDLDKKRLSLLLDNDVISFSDKGYSIHKALKGNFFINEKEPYNKIDKEIIRDRLSLPKERYKYIENRSEPEYLALYLMVHDNYYSNMTSKYLIITGKLIESIFCIFDNTLNFEEKKEQINRLDFGVPFLSGIGKNRYVDKLSNEKGSHVRLKLENIDYSNFINLFKEERELSFTSIFLYEVLKKYMNNINILKAGSYSKNLSFIDQDVNSVILSSPIFDTVKRVLYIFLNSLASFESRKSISSENIAIDGKVENIVTTSKAFLNNVANIQEDALTKYLYILLKDIIFSKDHEDGNENSIFTKVLDYHFDNKEVDIAGRIQRLYRKYFVSSLLREEFGGQELNSYSEVLSDILSQEINSAAKKELQKPKWKKVISKIEKFLNSVPDEGLKTLLNKYNTLIN